MTVPPYRHGIEYRELSPREGGRRHRYEHRCGGGIKLPFKVRDFKCVDATGKVWIAADCGVLWVMPTYRWDGCTPKRHVPLLGWIGTPDTPRTALASLIHDALYQASGDPAFPVTRQQADELFRDILRAAGFAFAGLYYGAVRDFGGCSWGAARGKIELKTILL